MKIKENISLERNEQNALLLAALGIIAVNTLAFIPDSSGNLSAQGEEESSEEVIVSPKNYIQNMGKALSANNYSAIKTLYKLQSVIEDIGAVSPVILEDQTTEASLSEIIGEIAPYLSSSKRAKVNGAMNNLDKIKRTYSEINGVRGRIRSLPEGTTKSERLKAIINEIPAISGIPILSSLNGVKNALSLIRSLPVSIGENKAQIDNSSPEEDLPQENDGEYEQIKELMELFEKKDARE